MHFLLDTNVLSEFFKRKPNARVLSWLAKQDSFGVSVITIDEIFFGLHTLNAANHLKWFKGLLEDRIQVFSIDAAIAEHSGNLRARFKQRGIQRTQADLLIAATTYFHNLTLVTRNEKDFLECQIPIFNPF
jgi:predicted nucleic acid-binding protein